MITQTEINRIHDERIQQLENKLNQVMAHLNYEHGLSHDPFELIDNQLPDDNEENKTIRYTYPNERGEL